MKNIFAITAVILLHNILSAQNTDLIFEDKISIRAIEIYDGKVWYAGTDSKFGYVDLKNPAEQKQIELSEKHLQFRTLAHDRNYFYTINIESPAYFFRINKKTLKAETVYTDAAETAFYDALHYHNGLFYTFSDPNKNLDLQFMSFAMNGNRFLKKEFSGYKMLEGEAAFAASNTNIAASRNHVWLATGGKSSRIFRLNLKTHKIDIFSTPFVQGSASQGIYSIDFFKDKFGVAVGGDYTKQQENIDNIAVTYDAGKTWQILARGDNAGYSTCIKIRPGSRGKDMVAIGDQHISLSQDFGKTWKVISAEKGFYVGEWLNRKTLVLAGNGKIGRMRIK